MRMAETRKPDIYFRENGQIDITSRVSKTLGLHPGDAINVWNAGGEYYLYVTERNVKGKFRGVCRKVNFGSNFLRANFYDLAKKIIALCGKREAHLPVGSAVEVDNIGTALPLITRNNLYDEQRH